MPSQVFRFPTGTQLRTVRELPRLGDVVIDGGKRLVVAALSQDEQGNTAEDGASRASLPRRSSGRVPVIAPRVLIDRVERASCSCACYLRRTRGNLMDGRVLVL